MVDNDLTRMGVLKIIDIVPSVYSTNGTHIGYELETTFLVTWASRADVIELDVMIIIQISH